MGSTSQSTTPQLCPDSPSGTGNIRNKLLKAFDRYCRKLLLTSHPWKEPLQFLYVYITGTTLDVNGGILKR